MLLKSRRSTPSTATSRRCSASTAVERAKRSPSSAPTAPASRPISSRLPGCCRPAGGDPLRRRADRRHAAARDREARHRPGAGRPTAVPSLTVEENLLIGGYGRPATAVVARKRLWAVSRCSRAPPSAGDRAVGRPAADGGHRARADVESARAAVRRDQPRPRAGSHPRHLCGAAAHQGRGHASSSSSRTSCGAGGRRPRLLLHGGPDDARPAAGDAVARAIHAAYFGD